MTIEQTNNDNKGFFRATDNGVQAGKMTYVWAGEQKLIIDHTEVNPQFSGQGVGKQMVMKAVEFARQNNIKILPLCPFAKSVFDKTQDLADVRA